jgi:hypothetical protein
MLRMRNWRTPAVTTIVLGILLAMASGAGVSRADASEEPNWKTFIVKALGQSYPIQYWIIGGRVVDMMPSEDTFSMTVTVDSTKDGTLTITLPRELLDSRTGADGTSGADEEFAAFVDEVPSDIVETEATSSTRTLAINFTKGTKSIEIVETWPGMSPPPPNAWIAQITGRFLYSDPPRPDQIFKAYYRVIDGTIEKLSVGGTKVSSSGNGTLEVKFPMNYPYTNEDITGRIDATPTLLIDGQFGEEITYSSITDCFFVFSIPFTGSKSIGLAWDYLTTNQPYHGDEIPDSCIPQTLVENVPTKKDGTISPWQQFKAGVAAEDAICPETKHGEKLMLLVSPDGRPFCVKLSDEGFMKKRGWTEPYQ